MSLAFGVTKLNDSAKRLYLLKKGSYALLFVSAQAIILSNFLLVPSRWNIDSDVEKKNFNYLGISVWIVFVWGIFHVSRDSMIVIVN